MNAVLDAYPDVANSRQGSTVIPTADRQKATVKVRISFTDDSRQTDGSSQRSAILPDMGVKVAFLEEDKPKAKGKGSQRNRRSWPWFRKRRFAMTAATKYVFVVKNGELERRAVTLGTARGTDVEILAGVQPGDASGRKGSRRSAETVRQSDKTIGAAKMVRVDGSSNGKSLIQVRGSRQNL